jgi:hypothetical protein
VKKNLGKRKVIVGPSNFGDKKDKLTGYLAFEDRDMLIAPQLDH